MRRNYNFWKIAYLPKSYHLLRENVPYVILYFLFHFHEKTFTSQCSQKLNLIISTVFHGEMRWRTLQAESGWWGETYSAPVETGGMHRTSDSSLQTVFPIETRIWWLRYIYYHHMFLHNSNSCFFFPVPSNRKQTSQNIKTYRKTIKIHCCKILSNYSFQLKIVTVHLELGFFSVISRQLTRPEGGEPSCLSSEWEITSILMNYGQ